MKISWSSRALQDLRRLYFFLRKENLAAALSALETIQNSIVNLEKFPKVGVPINTTSLYRELYISFARRFYVVRYRILSDNELVITRVWHSRENRLI